MILQIKDLKKSYLKKGKPVVEALQGISLDIHKGEVFSLLGANGAGKTTLSTIIASLHPPTSGQVLWEGRSIYGDLYRYRKTIGFCPQKPNLDRAFSVEENLLFSARFYGFSLEEAVKQKDHLMEQFGLQDYRHSTVDVLSGGYRQRFLLARTLMHRPTLVILDEPTVGLDPHIRRQIWQMIRDLKEIGVTVVLTTHYLDEAEALSDRVCIIHKGKLLLIDTPNNLKQDFQKANLEEVFIQIMKETENG